jgi:hypothetical protein
MINLLHCGPGQTGFTETFSPGVRRRFSKWFLRSIDSLPMKSKNIPGTYKEDP